ncbi:MAG: transposase [Rhodospirillum sp.]|nr:transposase [Rhodospirillum sp.]
MTTSDVITLQTLLAKEPDADIVREMLGFAAQRLMILDVEGKTGAAHGGRSPDRLSQRNGYRERNGETRVGTINLQIPKRRKGSYFPEFLEPRRMSEGIAECETVFSQPNAASANTRSPAR